MPFRWDLVSFESLFPDKEWVLRYIKRYSPTYKLSAHLFFNEVGRVLEKANSKWLDIGAGTNWLITHYDENGGLKLGVDITKSDKIENKNRFVLANIDSLPFKKCSFDLITAYFVVEHLKTPIHSLLEVSRILKQNGSFLMLTTNIFSPLILIMRIIPLSIKSMIISFLIKKKFIPHHGYYRFNNPKIIKLHSQYLPLKLVRIYLCEQLCFFNKILFFISIIYHRILSLHFLEDFRVNIVALFQKRT